MNWQPIATAPKDRKPVVLGFWRDGEWIQAVAVWMVTLTKWSDGEGFAEEGVYTHWHPISDPPKNEANPLNA